MKTKTLITGILFAVVALASAATNDLTSTLQRGLFEEEANHNLDAAAQAYQSVSAQFDKDRKLAATAIFRLGEVYRKQGKTNDATAQYERIVREFSDQQTLVTLSRQNLAGIGAKSESPAASSLTRAARLKQKELLEQEIKLVEQDLADLRKQLANGVVPQSEVRAKEREVLKLGQQVAALDVGTEDVASSSDAAAPVTDDEEKEIRRIQEMIKNSPDLINAPDAAGTLPLIAAASRGQLRVVQFLLGSGADVNRSVARDQTALHAAAENGHKAMVELLLARGAAVNAKDSSLRTALHRAAEKGYLTVAEVLVAKNADVNAEDSRGYTPLHLAVEKAHGEFVQLLLARGAAINARNQSGQTPLILAAQRGHQALVAALLAAKADPNIIDSNGRTALSLAAGNGHADTVKTILDGKADPNVGTSDLPLAVACTREGTNIATLLLRAGADPNREAPLTFDVGFYGRTIGRDSKFKLTPLQIAVAKGRADLAKLFFQFKADPKARRPASDSPLVWETFGNADLVKAFLAAGADPNSDNGDPAATLLYMTASGANAAAVETLLAAGARVNPPADARDTPLHMAVQKGDEKTIRLLLEAGAEVNRRNRENFTPLWKAVLGRKTDLAGLLLANGADPNLTVDNGTTPLHFAVGQQDRSLVQLLLTNKADVNLRDRAGKTPLDFAKEQLTRSGLPGYLSPGSIPAAPPPPSDQSRKVSDAQPVSPGTLADLLRQHGAVDDLPRVDRIEIRRASANFSTIPFLKGTNDWNQFNLLELIAGHYGLITDRRSGDPQPRTAKIPDIWPGNALRFPDFKKLAIHRPAADGRSWTTIAVNVADMLSSGDCSDDVTLRWGDVVEIPEADHPVTENWPGLPDPDRMALIKCVSRTVTVAINRTNALLKLSPVFQHAEPNAPIFLENGSFLGLGHAKLSTVSFLLRSVLDHSKLVRFSSDLTRVKVARRDPATGQTRDWLLDCSDPNQAPELWLRDGDVIEVPDKP